MAYPISGMCPADHPAALPVRESRVADNVSRLGGGYGTDADRPL